MALRSQLLHASASDETQMIGESGRRTLSDIGLGAPLKGEALPRWLWNSIGTRVLRSLQREIRSTLEQLGIQEIGLPALPSNHGWDAAARVALVVLLKSLSGQLRSHRELPLAVAAFSETELDSSTSSALFVWTVYTEDPQDARQPTDHLLQGVATKVGLRAEWDSSDLESEQGQRLLVATKIPLSIASLRRIDPSSIDGSLLMFDGVDGLQHPANILEARISLDNTIAAHLDAPENDQHVLADSITPFDVLARVDNTEQIALLQDYQRNQRNIRILIDDQSIETSSIAHMSRTTYGIRWLLVGSRGSMWTLYDHLSRVSMTGELPSLLSNIRTDGTFL